MLGNESLLKSLLNSFSTLYMNYIGWEVLDASWYTHCSTSSKNIITTFVRVCTESDQVHIRCCCAPHLTLCCIFAQNTETSLFFDIEEQVMKLEGAEPTDAATSTDPTDTDTHADPTDTDTHTEPTDTAASTEPADSVPTSSGGANRLTQSGTPWRPNMITNKAKKVSHTMLYPCWEPACTACLYVNWVYNGMLYYYNTCNWHQHSKLELY